MNNNPMASTLVLGFFSGLCAIVFTGFPWAYYHWHVVFKLYLLFTLILYTGLLCYWSNTSISRVVYPLLLVSGVALWPNTSSGFFLVVIAILSWIRSGICWKDVGLRASLGELVTLLGTVGFLLLWWPGSALSLSLAVWMFFLIQSLYYFIVPCAPKSAPSSTDSFEQSSLEVERLLRDSGKL